MTIVSKYGSPLIEHSFDRSLSVSIIIQIPRIERRARASRERKYERTNERGVGCCFLLKMSSLVVDERKKGKEKKIKQRVMRVELCDFMDRPAPSRVVKAQ